MTFSLATQYIRKKSLSWVETVFYALMALENRRYYRARKLIRKEFMAEDLVNQDNNSKTKINMSCVTAESENNN